MPTRRRLTLVVAVVAMLVVVTSAAATVRKVSLTSPVTAGEVASLTVNVSPRTRCALTVTVKAGSATIARPEGLGSKTGGRITWRWRVGTNVQPGSYPVSVNCGKSGKLRTRIRIIAAEPEMPLADAAKAVCDRAPARVLAKYKTELRSVAPGRTVDSLRREYGPLDCVFEFPNPTAEAGVWYLISTSKGPTPCTFGVTVRLIWENAGPPRPGSGYKGPVDEAYSETCKSLRG